jgi:hypothetical protein
MAHATERQDASRATEQGFSEREIVVARRAGLRPRVAPEQQLVNRVVGEAVGIVGIGMAAGEPEDPLGQQIAERVTHLARGAIIDQAAGEAVDQIVPALCRGQQDRAAVGTRMRLIEGCDEGFVEQVRKADSLWYCVVVPHTRLRCRKSLSSTALYDAEAFVFLPKSAPS